MKFHPELNREFLGRRKELFLELFFAFVIAICAVFQSVYLAKSILHAFFLNSHLLPQSLQTLVLVWMLRIACQWARERACANVAHRVSMQLRGKTARHLSNIKSYLPEHYTPPILANLYETKCDAVEPYFRAFLPAVISAATTPLVIIVYVLWLDALSGVVLLFTGPLIPFFSALIGNKAGAAAQKQWATLDRLSKHFSDLVRGWETIKLFKAEETVEKSVIEAGNAYKKSTLGILKTAFLSAFSLEFLATIATALVAVEIGFRVLYGRMDYETAITILILAPEFYIPLRNLGAAFHASVSGIEAMNSVGEFLNLPIPNFPVPTTSTVRELTQEEKANWSQIVLENVTVSYPNRGEPVLKNLSISLSRGEIVALVGPSGSGKSTFCHLLMGHLAPSAGQIWLENTPRVCISENSWHSLFSSIPQRPALAHATLRDNILLGRENVSEASIARACEMAQLTPILDKLPLKLETPVGENGVTLSTGQAHRVALARTFLSQSPIVILDEPTAHLDPKTEDAIHMSIKELSKTRTVIIVSHRESTLRFCDAILRFENRHVTKTPLKGKRS